MVCRKVYPLLSELLSSTWVWHHGVNRTVELDKHFTAIFYDVGSNFTLNLHLANDSGCAFLNYPFLVFMHLKNIVYFVSCLLSHSLYRTGKKQTSLCSCAGFPHKINKEGNSLFLELPPCIQETQVAHQRCNSSIFSLCSLTLRNFILWSCIKGCKIAADTRDENPVDKKDDDGCHSPLNYTVCQGLLQREGR